MDTKRQRLSVLMFPWLAHGHISPFLELAKKLSHRNFYVYFCSTPIGLSSIKNQVNENSFPCLELIELHLPTFSNLPPRCHITKSIPTHLMPTLKKAFDMAQPSFSNLLKNINPDLLIYDFIQPWAPAMASSLNIPSILFLITGAASNSFFLHLCNNPGVEFPFPAIYLEEHEDHKVAQLLQSSANGLTDKSRYVQCVNQSSTIILIKSFREIEAKYIDYLSLLTKKEIIPLGPLVQDPAYEWNQLNIIEWLGKKGESSTVFVSFGSEYFMTKEELEEIAHGLELSMVNFIWVVRFPEEEKVRVDEVLPEGFLMNIGERGIVVEGWAPQAKILGHSSIGGFVSHCGWSSVVEGMKFGVPIIAMPMHLDQPLDAKLVVELGVGLEVKIGKGSEGRFEREEVAKVIREVVVEKKGEVVRRVAKQMSDKIRNKKGDEEIDVVVEKLGQLSMKNEKRKDDLQSM